MVNRYHRNSASLSSPSQNVPAPADYALRAPRLTPPAALARICSSAPYDRALHASKGLSSLMTKNRNGSSNSKLYFRIRAVTFGTDEDGDAIKAPICDPAEGGRTASPRLPPQPLFALRILNDLILAEGKLLPPGAGFPSDKLRGVPEDRWRAECDSRRLLQHSSFTFRRRP